MNLNLDYHPHHKNVIYDLKLQWNHKLTISGIYFGHVVKIKNF